MGRAIARERLAEGRATRPLRLALKPLINNGQCHANFRADDAGGSIFVRIGNDLPLHGVMRFNQAAASREASAVGLSPEIVYEEPGALVFRFVVGRALEAEDRATPAGRRDLSC